MGQMMRLEHCAAGAGASRLATPRQVPAAILLMAFLSTSGSKRHFSVPFAASTAITIWLGVHMYTVSSTISGVFWNAYANLASSGLLSPVWKCQATSSRRTFSGVICADGVNLFDRLDPP